MTETRGSCQLRNYYCPFCENKIIVAFCNIEKPFKTCKCGKIMVEGAGTESA